MTLAIIIILVTLAVDLVTDYNLWLKGKKVDHTRGAIIRSIPLGISALLLSNELSIHWIPSLIISAGLIFFFWWTFFDGILNLSRNQKFFFPGSDDGKDDAFFDRLLYKLKYWQIGLLKIGGFIIFLLAYAIGI